MRKQTQFKPNFHPARPPKLVPQVLVPQVLVPQVPWRRSKPMLISSGFLLTFSAVGTGLAWSFLSSNVFRIVGCLGAHGTFWLYSGICVTGFIFIRIKLPETKGKSLEQIERELVD